ncbi:uncharacterized protein MYCGRDRAFT_38191 [Zymoseptoria tritici IPO323]|uniref:PrpF protein n=1 Tax=Zymoseptoria tritici (strain CBS 115943 / IPO323) TaxID=336722 RepID=F9X6I6_ZYMTI|nr:uncharacterized protein MYCGRDRAFT_38191 [Zymoseptoria tritici IPO323]EGP89189.1 hypothetical protein MYCGRDRAFT_38191 [Zymoseptoria tritici IPO323]
MRHAPRRQRRMLPAVWMRAGTSKGLFLHQRDLPPQREKWAPIILAAMGSNDSDPKQLNGVAGATSTTSKVAVIAPSERPDCDVEYTFVQVSIGSPKLDFTGNCGNICSGVGPFAVDEGLVVVPPGAEHVDVRILNTNTGRVIVETMEVDEDGHYVEDGDLTLPGTRAAGSRIDVAFEKPAGSMTGLMLPSGQPTEFLHIPGTIVRPSADVTVSLVDAANPFVLVDSKSIPESIMATGADSAFFLDFIEAVRCRGAVQMGLAADLAAAAKTRGTPKIAMLSEPALTIDSGKEIPDVEVTAFSMGKVHGSLQLTGAVCLASAICTPGTIANTIAKKAEQYRIATGSVVTSRRDSGTDEGTTSRKVNLRHPTGTIGAEAQLRDGEVESVKLWRTARRLFEGNVCFVA